MNNQSAHSQSMRISEDEKRKALAHQLVIDNALNAALVGIIPIPLIDVLLVGAIQLKMINELCLSYDTRFSKYLSEAILLSLLGGSATMVFDHLNGTIINVAWLKVFNTVGIGLVGGAVTYAIGQFFLQHLEKGGTLIDIDLKNSTESLTQLYEEGKNVINLKTTPGPS